jgi:DNA end-binding protein Ku
MARSLWNGTIVVGAIAVPIKLHSATQSKTVHFHEVHLDDGARIEHRRFCTAEDREVPYDEVVKGYELAEDSYVVLGKEEIAAAAGSRAKVVDVEEFVPAADIDPVHYAKTYYLGVRDEGDDAYRLLHDALEQTGRAAIGRFVFHNREYLAAIRPAGDGVLALHTLRFADEVVRGEELELPGTGRAPSDREAQMAAQLVEGMHQEFDPSAYRDEYRDAVLELIEAKAAGREPELPADEAPGDSGDLLAALQASLDAQGDRGERFTREKAGAGR